jgi:hypothetical protein
MADLQQPVQRPALQDIKAHPKDFTTKDIVAATLMANIDPTTKKLNLNGVASDFIEIAKRHATDDPNYDVAAKAGLAKSIVDRHTKTYNMTAREMMGITPDKSFLNTALEALGVSQKDTVPITCSVPKDIDYTKFENGLGPNGVTCRQDSPSAQR